MKKLAGHPSFPVFRCYSAADIAAHGDLLDGRTVHDITRRAWKDICSGRAYGTKSVLAIRPEEIADHPWLTDKTMPGERLGWKLNCLSSVNGRYGGVKIVGANALNRRLGLPRSKSTIVLLEKFTLTPLCVLDGTEISAARTASYATVVAERFLTGRSDISVFLFGAGPIAEKIILALDKCCGKSIRRLFVSSRTGKGAAQLAASIARKVGYEVIPVLNHEMVRECDFIITASNADAPVFEADEIGDALVLHLGGDETPTAFLQRAIRSGTVLCDNVEMVSHRASQSLAFYFSRHGATLEQLAAPLGIRSLSDVIEDPDFQPETPIHITCVGLPMLDLYVGAHIYERLISAERRSRTPSRLAG
ncbi:ornithine cyclodeaminase [Phyllobacterium leguminum]|uniref:Alanine dehydrogenase n=1 Tax=Phyllobacterium leguminum TaxID=314237 RepID=A0A318SWK6_9HYPH|nr:ornithine cyclodeaminase [Phyllobacterium leguminum]PYE86290.1 alanine dehydrogenase [Phyllobacterium leguminum]